MSEAFKKMPFKKKLEHIWEYYRVNIFLSVAAILLAGSLINAVFINPAPKTYVGVAFYDNYVNSEIIETLTSEFTKKFVPKEENLQVKFSSYYEVESDPAVAVDMAQKFEMLLYAKELDIIITGKNEKTGINYFSGFAKQGIIAPLDKIYTKEELSEFEEKGLLLYCEDAEGNKKPFGVSAKNTSSILRDYGGFDQEKKYIGISNTTEKADKAKQILKALSE